MRALGWCIAQLSHLQSLTLSLPDDGSQHLVLCRPLSSPQALPRLWKMTFACGALSGGHPQLLAVTIPPSVRVLELEALPGSVPAGEDSILLLAAGLLARDGADAVRRLVLPPGAPRRGRDLLAPFMTVL
jgi:hypothetical protein